MFTLKVHADVDTNSQAGSAISASSGAVDSYSDAVRRDGDGATVSSTSAASVAEQVTRGQGPGELEAEIREVSDTGLGDSARGDNNECIPFSSGNPKVESTRGVIHLFRNTTESPGSLHNLPQARGMELCVLAVPTYMTGADFCQFTGALLGEIESMRIVRNDSLSERYMVLMRMKSREAADGFFRQFNNKPFSSMETELCRVLFTKQVLVTGSEEDAATPPVGQTELPSCPVCLERLDRHISGILTTVCNHSFHSSCISKWTDSSCPVCRYCQQPSDKSQCAVCGSQDSLWICLICGFVGCGRYQGGHAESHFKASQHCYSLELSSQRVWDYVGDAFVHRLVLSKTDGKLVELPSPGELGAGGRGDGGGGGEGGNGGGTGAGGACAMGPGGSCSHHHRGDEEFAQAVMNSKLESVAYEYTHLLTTQLESQRLYFEGLLAAAKGERDEAVAAAEAAKESVKVQKLQSRLERAEQEKEFLRQVNDSLIKNQKQWQEKFKQQEERERAAIATRDEKIQDLEEQVRDLMVYIEAQKIVEREGGPGAAEGIREGTVLAMNGGGGGAGGSRGQQRYPGGHSGGGGGSIHSRGERKGGEGADGARRGVQDLETVR
ncbi:hypothetical protein CLOM_g23924 [Closterium sp. NIES-68]|nr:hypothetical protein CLOM_g23924 [Closterium sp. NIES-68]GJP86245.1 hypothetical protein CLOP_g16290 [Closterium sp. NIES-67]